MILFKNFLVDLEFLEIISNCVVEDCFNVEVVVFVFLIWLCVFNLDEIVVIVSVYVDLKILLIEIGLLCWMWLIVVWRVVDFVSGFISL